MDANGDLMIQTEFRKGDIIRATVGYLGFLNEIGMVVGSKRTIANKTMYDVRIKTSVFVLLEHELETATDSEILKWRLTGQATS